MGQSMTVQVHHLPAISYALAHNRVPVLSGLRLANGGPSVEAAAVRVEFRDALGVLSRPFERLVDLPQGADLVLDDLPVLLDAAQMLQVEEQRPGQVVVSVTSADGRPLGHVSSDVQVLAAAQWLRSPELVSLEILAAFVQPNSPAVTGFLVEVADLLAARTGSGSLPGYQDGPDRVDAVVHAAFDAMVARAIRYAEPPASWSDVGQKVRTPHDVLVGRVATCLDSVLTLAAVLEAAGINSTLWLTDGHAFLGYWRDDLALPAVAQTEVADVVNLVDLDAIRLVETTLVTAPDPSFAAARAEPYRRWLRADLDAVLGVVDLRRARQGGGIVPMPARSRAADGTVQIVEYHPREQTLPWSAAEPAADVVQAGRAAPPPRVQQWKNALLDLSLRNRLINFTPRAGIAVTVPAGGLGALEDAVSQGTRLVLLPGDQLDDIHRARGVERAADLAPQVLLDKLGRQTLYVDLASTGYLTRLRALAYRARTAIEETGSNNLYLALGALAWTHDERALRSPLVLVPVRLAPRNRSQTYLLELDETGASTPNFCLLEKLRVVHGLHVPGLAERAADGSGLDLESALRAMREAVAAAGLPYRVEETADLAVLQFAKFRLWKDLDEHWEQLAENPLVDHLVHAPTQPFADPVPAPHPPVDLDELGARLPTPADAPQLQAVADAVAGRTFVLEGPPGTGKSQTITNVLAEAVREGRRVLFVAEKRAALDVVRRRLEGVGLGPLALDLHDTASKPSAVRAQVARAIEYTVDVDREGLAVAAEDLRTARAHLTRYAQRLHAPNGAGLSLYTAWTAGLAHGGAPMVESSHGAVRALPVPQTVVEQDAAAALPIVRRALETLPETADLAVPTPTHPWGFLGPQVDPDLDVEALRRAVRAVDAALAALPAHGPWTAALHAARRPDQVRTLGELLAGDAALALLDTAATPGWQRTAAALCAEVDALDRARHPALDVLTPDVLALDLAALDREVTAAAGSFFLLRSRRLRAAGAPLAPVLRPGTVLQPRATAALVSSARQLQDQLVDLTARLGAVPGLARPPGWTPFVTGAAQALAEQVDRLTAAGRAVTASPRDPADARFAEALRDLLRELVPSQASGGLVALAEAFEELLALATCSQDEIARWAGDSLVDRWRQTAAGRRTDDSGMLGDPGMLGARRWLAFVADLRPLAEAGLDDAVGLLLRGVVPAAEAAQAFALGVAQTSVQERSRATGLDAFDPVQHERMVSRFGRATATVRTEMAHAVPYAVVSGRTIDVDGARGQIGGLRRELARQRGGLGVRRLLQTYGDLVTRLMPVVLVSPDSLARFLPVGPALFDLVVFDEASQIRVADAVGAMGRARSVVVVGDSRQLPPTSFAEPSTGLDEVPDERDDESLLVEDEESILRECVQAQVPRQWLTWHYRSQDESLIAFSNQHYYGDRLASFPTPRLPRPDPSPDGHGISLVRVDGVFHRTAASGPLRTNPVEAAAVVADLRRRFDAAQPGVTPSVGVVTFNIQQRTLVESLLRDTGDPRIVESLERTDGEGLFVKNLENVQGDERDVVLFSTAFSVNARGVLPLNFGPLNQFGGERRLNVAVTRARRQVVVFSSFAPDQLRAQETSSVGVKHLRAYLDLAAGGPQRLVATGTRRPVVDRHRDDLAARLRARGLVVRTDLGLSEFRVELSLAVPQRPDEARVAVLLDGPGWAARRTAIDRDALPVDVLTRLLGWPAVERVWLGSWLRDPEPVLDRLEAVARAEPVVEVVPPQVVVAAPWVVRADVPEDVAQDVAQDVAASVRRAGQTPFVPWTPGRLGPRAVLDGLPGPRSTAAVRDALVAGVQAEGPVQLDRLVRLAAAAFDLSRVSAARSAAILAALPAELVPDPAEPFAWPTGLDAGSWAGYRAATPAATRPVEAICPRELGNAMVSLCTAAAGMSRAELFVAVVEVFGGKRVTAGATTALAAALDRCLTEERLHEDAGLFQAGLAAGP